MKKKLEKPNADSVVRTIALVAVLANQCMVMFGRESLPFTDDEIYSGISAAATAVVSIWAWWKNNSFTAAAKAGDVLKDEVKNKISKMS